MLAQGPTSFKIEIPVDSDLLPEARTPGELAAEKHSNLSTPRVSKSPSELRKAEEQSVLLRAVHLEAVQARAARETQRAADAKARRLRAEANSRAKLTSRFSEVAKRDALKADEKKQATHERARIRAARAEEARCVRQAIAEARNEKLSSASERVEESSRRAADIVEATAAKNAHFVKRALALVAAHRQNQRNEAEAASVRLAAKIAAATERRNDALEAAQSRASLERVEMARLELVKLEVERQHKKMELDRSIAAALERRDSKLEMRVEKARADISRVNAAHDAKIMMALEAEAELAESRRAIFAKLNAADVRAKEERSRKASKDLRPGLGSRKASRVLDPLAFEIPVRDSGTEKTSLSSALVKRLKIKSRTSHIKPMTDLETRKALSADARVGFARKDLAATRDAIARRQERVAALAAKVDEQARRGASLAQNHVQLRAHTAKRMNARVGAASVRRATADSEKRKAVARRVLRAAAASGRRAQRLLSTSNNSLEANRTEMFLARRDVIDASRVTRAQSHVLRSLVVSMRGSELLMQKAARAHMSTLPYNRPAKLTQSGGIMIKKLAETGAETSGSSAGGSVSTTSNDVTAARFTTKPDLQQLIKAQNMAKAAETASTDMSFISNDELRQIHALAKASIGSDEDWQVVSDRQSGSS